MWRNVPLFAGLDEAGCRVLERDVRRRRYEPRRVIYSEGDAAHAVYAVLSGYLKATCCDTEGRAVVESILGPGDVFGELSLLDGAPRGATITTLENSELAVIGGECFTGILESSFALNRQLLSEMARRVRRLSKRCEDRSSSELSVRLSAALLEIAERFGKRAAFKELKIPFHLSQQELGSMVGASRESVNKWLRTWTERGLISHQRGLLTIVDPERFRSQSAAYERPRRESSQRELEAGCRPGA